MKKLIKKEIKVGEERLLICKWLAKNSELIIFRSFTKS
jgi:hypothetical protein